MKNESIFTVILGTAIVSIILAVVIFGWQVFIENWRKSRLVKRWHLTLWVRLAIIAAIVLFVAWQFIPYQSVLK